MRVNQLSLADHEAVSPWMMAYSESPRVLWKPTDNAPKRALQGFRFWPLVRFRRTGIWKSGHSRTVLKGAFDYFFSCFAASTMVFSVGMSFSSGAELLKVRM